MCLFHKENKWQKRKKITSLMFQGIKNRPYALFPKKKTITNKRWLNEQIFWNWPFLFQFFKPHVKLPIFKPSNYFENSNYLHFYPSEKCLMPSLALEPSKFEVLMSVHGFVKIVEFWLLKLQHEGKNKQNEHEVGKVSEILFQRLKWHSLTWN